MNLKYVSHYIRSRYLHHGRCPIISKELQEVVAKADQVPLGRDFFKTAQQKMPETPNLLDLTKDRFDDLLALSISAAPFGRTQFPGHAILGCGRFGNTSPRGRKRPVRVLQPTGRYVTINAFLG